jgi:hypothetical protein
MDQTPERISETPELDKEKEARISGRSQIIGEFLEWLDNTGYVLCRSWPDGYASTSLTTDDLLDEYFDIDKKKAERERSALLQHLRKVNGISD